jgi:hypothetical protein
VASSVRREKIIRDDIWFDENLSYCEDAQFFIYSARVMTFSFIEDCTALIRKHEENSDRNIYHFREIDSVRRRLDIYGSLKSSYDKNSEEYLSLVSVIRLMERELLFLINKNENYYKRFNNSIDYLRNGLSGMRIKTAVRGLIRPF